jgi:hypothetical protein
MSLHTAMRNDEGMLDNVANQVITTTACRLYCGIKDLNDVLQS